MVSGFEFAFLAALAGFIGAFVLFLIWTFDQTSEAWNTHSSMVDPILGARDQVAIHDSHGPFVPMPDHLKTHDEMVTWMTRELPKLTADLTRGMP